MNAEKMIKNEAKNALTGKWVIAITSLFILLFVPIIVMLIITSAYSVLGESSVEELFSQSAVKLVLFVFLHAAGVAALLLLSPIFPGFVRVYSSAACGKETSMSEVFHFFESKQLYRSAIAFMSGLLVKSAGIIIACEAAALVAAFVGSDTDDLDFVIIGFAILGVIGAFLWFHRFAFQTMLFSYYDYDSATAAKIGSQIAAKNTGKLIKLTATFIPWLLLTYLVVPFLYVFPYMTCAYFVSIKYITADYLKNTNTLQPTAADNPIIPESTEISVDNTTSDSLPEESVHSENDDKKIDEAPQAIESAAAVSDNNSEEPAVSSDSTENEQVEDDTIPDIPAIKLTLDKSPEI